MSRANASYVTLMLIVGGVASTFAHGNFVPTARTGVAIQEAIDSANAAGGGRVVLEKGVYESGTIYLKDNIELHVPEGTVIRGGSRPEDYDDVDDPRIGKRPEKSTKAFVVGLFVTNVAITGRGVIDGQGPKFYDTKSVLWERFYQKPPHPRPRMVEFVGCRQVRFEDVTFRDSPGWTCWMRMCEDFSAVRVKILADQWMINNDGFHVDGCRRVRISDCDIKTGDDCIVMRAIRSPNGDSELCEDMTVENCRLNSSCQCVRLGCPSDGTIRCGIFRNLTMRGYNGIVSNLPVNYLQEGDHGRLAMEGILFSSCDIDVVDKAISLEVEPGIRLRSFGNVTFRDLTLKCGEPIRLLGNGLTPLTNVRFENVRGEVKATQVLETRLVRGLVFRDFEVTCAAGSVEPLASNESDAWERIQ